jgi:hypothetical protein
VNPELKYGGEALTLAWLGFRLLRWAWGAVEEGDAPPGAEMGDPVTIGAGLMGNVEERLRATHGVAATATHGVAATGDPDLFPPEMLAAMTPEQRAHVLETLAKQRAKGTAA